MRLCLLITLVLTINSGECRNNNKETRRNSHESSSIEYYTKHRHHVPLPVIIHFDKALTDRLAAEYKIKTRKKLKEISKSILKEVESYYRHPSLNYSIHLSLQDTRFLRKNLIELDDNASSYLRKYCTWQGERKRKGERWWYSILLTGLDLYYLNNNGKVRSSTGRGYMGGVCAINKSCTLLEWNPKNIGYLLAHELGHSLGMNHDSAPHNTCRPRINIMSSKYHPLHHPKSWSQCNRNDLQRFLLKLLPTSQSQLQHPPVLARHEILEEELD
ncbi:hypothetical protein evm_014717 [Chilo suppressalis]|nr:hypothetical protein evm_014717 [Chilo suppressalis]